LNWFKKFRVVSDEPEFGEGPRFGEAESGRVVPWPEPNLDIMRELSQTK
jgi:hypothetical protein